MRAQGGARLFFGFRVPALFVISAPPAKFTFAYSALLCYLPAYYLADNTAPYHIQHHTPHHQHNSSPISHTNSDSFSIIFTTCHLDPMRTAAALI